MGSFFNLRKNGVCLCVNLYVCASTPTASPSLCTLAWTQSPQHTPLHTNTHFFKPKSLPIIFYIWCCCLCIFHKAHVCVQRGLLYFESCSLCNLSLTFFSNEWTNFFFFCGNATTCSCSVFYINSTEKMVKNTQACVCVCVGMCVSVTNSSVCALGCVFSHHPHILHCCLLSGSDVCLCVCERVFVSFRWFSFPLLSSPLLFSPTSCFPVCFLTSTNQASIAVAWQQVCDCHVCF